MTANNGTNAFDVSFGRIQFLRTILESHDNVAILSRHDDIVFEIKRLRQRDVLSIVCVDEYSASLEFVMRLLKAFPDTDVIFVGGRWNSYTRDAQEFCDAKNIGIFNAKDLPGGLHNGSFGRARNDARNSDERFTR